MSEKDPWGSSGPLNEKDVYDKFGSCLVTLTKTIHEIVEKIRENEDIIDGLLKRVGDLEKRVDGHCKRGEVCPHTGK